MESLVKGAIHNIKFGYGHENKRTPRQNLIQEPRKLCLIETYVIHFGI